MSLVRFCPPTLAADFYKINHRPQYPKNTTSVFATWIPRESRVPDIDSVVAFGFQGFIKDFLIDGFNEDFFNRPVDEVCAEYARIIKYSLGVEDPDVSHLRWLHNLGYLPLTIKAVPEGTSVPLRVPMLTIENTEPEAFWLTNFIESVFSCEIWHPSTTATVAREFRHLLNEYAQQTGGDIDFVPFQGHDFSFRGMEGLWAAAKSGAAHLLSFVGTDTIPSIPYLEKYYGANVENELVGASVNATEHSVMCADTDEMTTFTRLLGETYPTGILSVVSDTYDLWKVLIETLPKLKEMILARDGKLVIRPDSGDPADILCGTGKWYGDHQDGDHESPESKGVVELLWDLFGGTLNAKGYKVLDPHIGTIYGDSITYDRAQNILERLKQKGFCSTNVVLGIGSFTYQYQTRDTFGFALKSTWVIVDGRERNIFKDPVTDKKHMKKSLTGRVVVYRDEYHRTLRVQDGLSMEEWELQSPFDVMEVIFHNGNLTREETLAEIRERVLASIQ